MTPHTSFIALDAAPQQAYANIQALRADYPGVYGADGFFDAVNPTTGAVGHRDLVLDQSMIMAALDNALENRAIQRDFANDPVSWAARTYLSLENNVPLTSSPPEGDGFQPLRRLEQQLRFAVRRPGYPEASPRSHGVPRRDVPGRVHIRVAGDIRRRCTRKTAWLLRDFGSTCPHAEQRWLVNAGLIFSTRPGAFSSRRRARRPQPDRRISRLSPALARTFRPGMLSGCLSRTGSCS